MCLCPHEATVFSPQKCHKILNAKWNYMDYNQKCCVLKLLPLDKQLLLNKCVLMQTVVHGKVSKYLKDLMIPSQLSNEFLLFGLLAWNRLPHHLKYPMELKTFKRKEFQALAKPSFLKILLFLSFLSRSPHNLIQNV